MTINIHPVVASLGFLAVSWWVLVLVDAFRSDDDEEGDL